MILVQVQAEVRSRVVRVVHSWVVYRYWVNGPFTFQPKVGLYEFCRETCANLPNSQADVVE